MTVGGCINSSFRFFLVVLMRVLTAHLMSSMNGHSLATDCTCGRHRQTPCMFADLMAAVANALRSIQGNVVRVSVSVRVLCEMN